MFMHASNHTPISVSFKMTEGSYTLDEELDGEFGLLTLHLIVRRNFTSLTGAANNQKRPVLFAIVTCCLGLTTRPFRFRPCCSCSIVPNG